jgi:DNA-binding CsgD family transcriptional regulator
VGLSDREREVLGLFAGGWSTRRIVQEWHVTPATVRTHVQNVLAKLGVHSKPEAVALPSSMGRLPATAGHRGTATAPSRPSRRSRSKVVLRVAPVTILLPHRSAWLVCYLGDGAGLGCCGVVCGLLTTGFSLTAVGGLLASSRGRSLIQGTVGLPQPQVVSHALSDRLRWRSAGP